MTRCPLRASAIPPLLALAALCACAPPAPHTVGAVPLDSPAARIPGPGADTIRTLAPRLTRGPNGSVALSWLEDSPTASRLRFARLTGPAWSEPATAAEGPDWFVNWADTPSVTPLGHGAFLAHWLQKTGDAPYAYAVRLSRSTDGGATWSPPFTPHTDASPTEHGFVSVVPDGKGGADIVWLDGRAMAGGHDGGATALMHAALDTNGEVGIESVLDARVCDCCATSAARLDDGTLVVAYRDRDEKETRDISVVTRAPDGSARKARVPGDGWVIAGCPVNGPSLASDGTRLALAWFTLGSDGAPRVLASVSRDRGATFAEPVELTGGSAGTAPTGRVAVAPDGRGGFAVSYIAEWGGATQIVVIRLDGLGRPAGRAAGVATTSRARSAGFPALTLAPDGGHVVAWTTPTKPSRVQTVRLQPEKGAPQTARP